MFFQCWAVSCWVYCTLSESALRLGFSLLSSIGSPPPLWQVLCHRPWELCVVGALATEDSYDPQPSAKHCAVYCSSEPLKHLSPFNNEHKWTGNETTQCFTQNQCWRLQLSTSSNSAGLLRWWWCTQEGGPEWWRSQWSKAAWYCPGCLAPPVNLGPDSGPLSLLQMFKSLLLTGLLKLKTIWRGGSTVKREHDFSWFSFQCPHWSLQPSETPVRDRICFFFLLPAGTHTVCINVGRTPKHKINNKTLKSFPKNTKNGEKLLKIFAL